MATAAGNKKWTPDPGSGAGVRVPSVTVSVTVTVGLSSMRLVLDGAGVDAEQ
jgi:hypothetical protein